jgi:2-C-methyl-D-erythritol 4-phosphate cytidylyltransferase
LLPLPDGRSVLEHSVDAFEQASCIDEIAIVMHPDWLDEAQRIARANNWQKLTRIIPGGAERWESSWKAIDAFSHHKTPVSLLLHDAARPFVSQKIIVRVCKALDVHAAVTVAVPVTDTLYRVGFESVEDVPARNEYMRAQTPQAFHLDTIRKAYRKAMEDELIIATDDAGIVHKYLPDVPIHIVPGDENNRKITYPEDLGR